MYPPQVVNQLLALEEFSETILEPAAGLCHISDVLEKAGYDVIKSDKISRREDVVECDFFDVEDEEMDVDIITNPPYSFAAEFVAKSLSIVGEGHKVAMFLKLVFLEGKKRKELFDKYPPKTIYVSRSRVCCWPNGVEKTQSSVCYAWFIWQKGIKGDPVIKWFN